jgi:hypothetical protein
LSTGKFRQKFSFECDLLLLSAGSGKILANILKKWFGTHGVAEESGHQTAVGPSAETHRPPFCTT